LSCEETVLHFFLSRGQINDRFPYARQGPPAPLLIAPHHKSHLQPLPRVLPPLVPWVMDDLPFPWLWQCITLFRCVIGEERSHTPPSAFRTLVACGLSWVPSHGTLPTSKQVSMTLCAYRLGCMCLKTRPLLAALARCLVWTQAQTNLPFHSLFAQ